MVPQGDSLPGCETTAFDEVGKSPVVPGPLIRVAAGTEVHLTVRNNDVPDTLRFEVPGAHLAMPGEGARTAPRYRT